MISWTVLAVVLFTVPARAEPRQSIVAQRSACHGEDGIAQDTEIPHLAGQNERYLFNQMMAFRPSKRPHKEMRFTARDMTTQEIAALVTYYASLPPRLRGRRELEHCRRQVSAAL